MSKNRLTLDRAAQEIDGGKRRGAFMKKTLLISLAVMLAVLCSVANAADTIEPSRQGVCGDNLMWELSSDHTNLRIYGTGPMCDYSYPESYAPWYHNINSIKHISIEEGVTSVGDHAFYGCDSLSSVDIPYGITRIGYCAFGSCLELEGVNLPNSITVIDGYAFSWCPSMTRMEIPQGVISIGSHAFSSCENLASINIPNSVQKIGDHAFDLCDNLTAISIPSSVIEIGDGVFSSCRNLKKITSKSALFSAQDSILMDNRNSRLLFYPPWKTNSIYTIPSFIRTIGANAFERCDSLETVIIPEGVSELGWGAFFWCGNLKNVVLPRSIQHIGWQAFANCDNLENIYYAGTQQDWLAVEIEATYIDNPLNNAAVHFESRLDLTEASFKKQMSKAVIKLSKSSYNYDGKAKRPTVTVMLDGRTLKRGKDYTVSYQDNKNPGTATVRIKGKGDYTGYSEAWFDIVPVKSISGATVKLSRTSYTYNGKARKPVVTVTFDGEKLKRGKDYTIKYSNNIMPGTATVTIKGKGNYTGTITREYTIR